MKEIKYKCPKCTGDRHLRIDSIKFTNLICDYCWGKPELDWMEYLFGVDKSYYDD